MALYQPEGTFGPICDSGSSAIAEAGGFVEPPPEDDGFRIKDGPRGSYEDLNIASNMKCKERTLPDGTIELYDCKVCLLYTSPSPRD